MCRYTSADSYGTSSGLDGRSEVLLGNFLRECPSPNASEAGAATFTQTLFASLNSVHCTFISPDHCVIHVCALG